MCAYWDSGVLKTVPLVGWLIGKMIVKVFYTAACSSVSKETELKYNPI